jgi:hypothetical protein
MRWDPDNAVPIIRRSILSHAREAIRRPIAPASRIVRGRGELSRCSADEEFSKCELRNPGRTEDENDCCERYLMRSKGYFHQCPHLRGLKTLVCHIDFHRQSIRHGALDRGIKIRRIRQQQQKPFQKQARFPGHAAGGAQSFCCLSVRSALRNTAVS